MIVGMLRGTAGVHRADAVVLAGYGGEEAGTGLADVIFGQYNPAGRLPYTVPTGLEQLQIHLNRSAAENSPLQRQSLKTHLPGLEARSLQMSTQKPQA